jgi:hypothetical protein
MIILWISVARKFKRTSKTIKNKSNRRGMQNINNIRDNTNRDNSNRDNSNNNRDSRMGLKGGW